MARDFTRILVPTDFSAPSKAAIAMAKELATRFGASIHLVHVLDDPFVNGTFAADIYAPPPASLRESWIQGAEALIGAQFTPEELAQFGIVKAVLYGAPARTIVDYAATHGVDLIVMGTHGRGGVAHLLMGSVAERVVRTAFCPVLTTREDRAADVRAREIVATAAV